jgi:hypothetical protein
LEHGTAGGTDSRYLRPEGALTELQQIAELASKASEMEFTTPVKR